VMAISLGRPIQKVTIEPKKIQTGGQRLGACQLQKGRSGSAKDWLEDEVLILLAGMVAEARFTGRYCQQGAGEDLRAAGELLSTRADNPRRLEKQQRRMLEKTEHLLDDPTHIRAIELIAEELLIKSTISGRAVRHFFHQAQQQTS